MLRPGDLGPGASTRTFLEAMRSGRLHLARFVLDALDGAIVDCRAEREGRTPLMAAVLLPEPSWRLAFAALLLDRGAAPDLRDDAGRTALSLACERGLLDAAQLLVQRGADPEALDARGWSPLMHAAARGHHALLEWLLRAFRRLGHLDLHRQDPRGLTALQLAALGGHKRCVRALRAAGALRLRQEEKEKEEEKAHQEGRRGAPRVGKEKDEEPPLAAEAAAAAASGPPPPRGRPLVRRATAPDCQSLLGY